MDKSAGPRGAWLAYALAAVAAAAMVILFGLQMSYANLIGAISNLATVLFAGIAAASGFYSVRKYKLSSGDRFSRAWLGFALGMTLWFLGEVTWEAYTIFGNVTLPYPSLADVFYIGGYVPFALGVYLYVQIFKNSITRGRILLVGGMVAASALIISWFFIAPVVTEVADPLTRFFDFAYPTMDLVLLSITILGVMIFLGGTIGRSWLLILVALVLEVAGDLSFTYLTANGTYYNGSYNDLIYILAYIVFALAFAVHRWEF